MQPAGLGGPHPHEDGHPGHEVPGRGCGAEFAQRASERLTGQCPLAHLGPHRPFRDEHAVRGADGRAAPPARGAAQRRPEAWDDPAERVHRSDRRGRSDRDRPARDAALLDRLGLDRVRPPRQGVAVGKDLELGPVVKVGEALVEQLGERAQLLARGEGPFGADRKLHIGQDAERAQPDAGRLEVRPVDPVQLAVAVDQPHRLDQRGERADRGAAAMGTGADRPSDGDAVATGDDVDRQAVPRQLRQQVVQLLAGPHPHPVRVERDDAGECGRVERDVVGHRQRAPRPAGSDGADAQAPVGRATHGGDDARLVERPVGRPRPTLQRPGPVGPHGARA